MNNNEFLYKDKTYDLRGILFSVHNELGRFAKEKQYGDKTEKKFKLKKSFLNGSKAWATQEIFPILLFGI